MSMIVVAIVIFAIAVLMTMTGRGGGNFYVLVLVVAGHSIHQAATTGQFILMLTAFAGMLIFHKHNLIDWKLALVIDPPTDIMAFVGGYFSGYVSGISLKFILAGLLILATIIVLMVLSWKKRIKREEFFILSSLSLGTLVLLIVLCAQPGKTSSLQAKIHFGAN